MDVVAGNDNVRIPFSSDILAFHVSQAPGSFDLGLLFLRDKPWWALIPPEPAGLRRLAPQAVSHPTARCQDPGPGRREMSV